MQQVELLRSLPKTKRNICARQVAKSAHTVTIAKLFGPDYFDGSRRYSYGGYKYDGRWVPVAWDIIEHYAYALKPGMRILDVGCAKGFLIKDLMGVCPIVQAYGLDYSLYALRNCHPDVKGRLCYGSADTLPYPDKCFDLALSINTLHNLRRDQLVAALRELTRVSHKQFVQVDSYETSEQKAAFESWVLTAEFHDYPDGWLKLFAEAGYTGEYDWTIVQ